jgi:ferredoxin-NADP reductase
MTSKQIWKTAAVIQETTTTVTVVFDTGGVPFIYKAGQFINITLTIEGVPVTRSYSLSSLPDDANPSVTVKRVEGGVMSNYIADNAARINNWHIDGPYGNFTPPDDAYNAGHIVLLAGGSGITPLHVIARSIVNKSSNATVTLIYSSRTAEEIIFSRSIEDLVEKHKVRIKIYYALSTPIDTENILGGTVIKGRINKLLTKKLIRQAAGDALSRTWYFICGPSGLMKMHQEVLEAMQVPAENIYMEYFAPEDTDEQISFPQEPQEVLLHFYEQTNLLEVQVGQSILMAALVDKVPLPYSCKTGTCGKCTAKLLKGKVKLVNNYALRQPELDAGWILLCQSYPLSNDITVEVM